jgi:tetratricopeptide (TPR) repeat protein
MTSQPIDATSEAGEAKTASERGWALLRQSSFSEALENFEKAILLEPGLPTAYLGRGYCRVMLGEHEADASKTIARTPPKPTNADEYSALGDELLGVREPDGALISYTRAIELEAGHTDARLRRAMLYLVREEIQLAENDLTEVINAKGERPEAYHLRAFCRSRLHQYAEAVDDFNEVLRRNPQNALALQQRADARMMLGDATAAESDYARAIELEPASVDVHLARARALSSLADYDRALESLAKAIELNPQDPAPYTTRGIQYELLGRFEDARADYERALELGDESAEAYRNRGDANKARGELEEAIDDYTRSLKRDPAFAPALMGRASALEAKFDFNRAIADYTQALTINPHLTGALLGRARAHVATNASDQALQDFDAVLALDPASAEAYIGRGDALAALGDDDRAVADYARALELDPRDASPHRKLILAQFRVGDEYVNRGLQDAARDAFLEALQHIDAALEVEEGDATFHGYRAACLRVLNAWDRAVDASSVAFTRRGGDEPSTRAWLHRERGDSLRQWGAALGLRDKQIEALRDFEQAAASAGDDAEVALFELWGNALLDLKRYPEAIDRFAEALRRDPKLVWSQIGTGKAHYLARDYSAAEAAFERASAEKTSDARSIAHVGRGLALEARGAWQDAEHAFRQALAEKTSAEGYVDRAGWFLFYDEFRRAERDFRTALELDASLTDALNGLAWLYIEEAPEAEHFSESFELAERAVELQDASPHLANYLDTAGWAAFRLGRHRDAYVRLKKAVDLDEHDVQIRAHLDEVKRELSTLDRVRAWRPN